MTTCIIQIWWDVITQNIHKSLGFIIRCLAGLEIVPAGTALSDYDEVIDVVLFVSKHVFYENIMIFYLLNNECETL